MERFSRVYPNCLICEQPTEIYLMATADSGNEKYICTGCSESIFEFWRTGHFVDLDLEGERCNNPNCDCNKDPDRVRVEEETRKKYEERAGF